MFKLSKSNVHLFPEIEELTVQLLISTSFCSYFANVVPNTDELNANTAVNKTIQMEDFIFNIDIL